MKEIISHPATIVGALIGTGLIVFAYYKGGKNAYKLVGDGLVRMDKATPDLSLHQVVTGALSMEQIAQNTY